MPEINQFGNPFSGLSQGGGGINPGQATPATPEDNPLGMLNSMLDIQGSKQRNELLKAQTAKAFLEMQQAQQEVQAKNLMGQMFQKRFNPEEGAMDWNGFFSDVLQSPITAKYGADVYAAGRQTEGLEANNAKTILEGKMKQAQFFGKTAAKLQVDYVNKGKNIPVGAVSSAVMNGVAIGLYDKQFGAQLLSAMPPEGPALNNAVKQYGSMAELSEQEYNNTWGKIEMFDQGGAFVPVQTNSGGAQQLGGGVMKTPTPDQMNDLVPVTGPDGVTTTYPRHAVPGAPMVGGTGQPVDGQAPGQAGISGPDPIDMEIRTGEAKDFVTYQKEVLEGAESANSTMAMLDQAESAFKRTKTGAGSSIFKFGAEFLQALGEDDLANEVAGGQLAALQEIKSFQDLIGVKVFKDFTKQPNRDLAQKEFERMVGTTFSIDKDPKAAMNVLNFTKNLMELQVIKAQMLADWRKKGKPPMEFRTWWNAKERAEIAKGEKGILWRGIVK